MNIELLAKEMRDRALLLEANPKYKAEQLQGKFLQQAKTTQLQRLNQLKKLYFNAGRWAGGARDHTAREAFEKVNKNDLRA